MQRDSRQEQAAEQTGRAAWSTPVLRILDVPDQTEGGFATTNPTGDDTFYFS